MDRIIVKSNADMGRVLDWAEELHGLTVELPWSEGEIEFQEELLTLRFKDEGAPVVSFELFTKNMLIVSWRSNLASGEIEELHINGEGQQKIGMSLILARDNTLAKCVRKFRGLMLFAAYYREEVAATRVVNRTGRSNGKSGKRSHRRPLTVRTYNIGSDMLSELPAPKKMWTGYAESFGVRGHYRRYKSGKVVWVRPYEKKGREEKKAANEYIL